MLDSDNLLKQQTQYREDVMATALKTQEAVGQQGIDVPARLVNKSNASTGRERALKSLFTHAALLVTVARLSRFVLRFDAQKPSNSVVCWLYDCFAFRGLSSGLGEFGTNRFCAQTLSPHS